MDISFRVETASTGMSGLGRIARAFHSAGMVLADSIANQITTIFFLLPWAIVGVPAIWLSVKLWRRRKFSNIAEEPSLRAKSQP